jgi:hypothetical protein
VKPKKHFVFLLHALALVVVTSPCAAQPAGGKDRGHEKSDERRQKREERREQRKERADDRKERADGGSKEDKKERFEARRERRRQRAEELRARYGRLLAEPAVAAELRVHARRMARLHTLRKVAEKEGKTALLPRIDKLIEKERTRHQRHMDAHRPGGAAAPAASASASYGAAQ